MQVESLVYRPTFGGMRHGLFTLELRLGGQASPRFSNTELVGRIMQAAAEKDPRTRVITIKDWTGENEPWEIMELVSSLRDTFEIVSDTTGYVKPGWTSYATRKRVWVTEEPWLLFQADELFYTPSTSGIYSEPQVPGACMNAMRYVVLSGKGSTEYGQNLMNFLRGTQVPWMVLSQPVTTYEFQIL